MENIVLHLINEKLSNSFKDHLEQHRPMELCEHVVHYFEILGATLKKKELIAIILTQNIIIFISNQYKKY